MGYTVDAVGNVLARGSDSFSYDQALRLTGATVGGLASSFTYDGDGLRVRQSTGGVTSRLVYDIAAGLPVLLDDAVQQVVWGPTGPAYAVDSSGSITVLHPGRPGLDQSAE